MADAFIDAAVDQGYPRNKDYNNGQPGGLWLLPGYAAERRALVGAPAAYLDPIRKRPNLKIETEAYATKVCCWRANARWALRMQQGGLTKEARANREVIFVRGSGEIAAAFWNCPGSAMLA